MPEDLDRLAEAIAAFSVQAKRLGLKARAPLLQGSTTFGRQLSERAWLIGGIESGSAQSAYWISRRGQIVVTKVSQPSYQTGYGGSDTSIGYLPGQIVAPRGARTIDDLIDAMGRTIAQRERELGHSDGKTSR